MLGYHYFAPAALQLRSLPSISPIPTFCGKGGPSLRHNGRSGPDTNVASKRSDDSTRQPGERTPCSGMARDRSSRSLESSLGCARDFACGLLHPSKPKSSLPGTPLARPQNGSTSARPHQGSGLLRTTDLRQQTDCNFSLDKRLGVSVRFIQKCFQANKSQRN
jgi:hypothetical protein